MAALVEMDPPAPLRQTCREDDLIAGSPSIKQTDIAALVESPRSGSIGTGPRMVETGFKYHMTDCRASLGLRQFARIQQFQG